MDGSALHNRLKYLGIIDKPSLSNTFNIDKIYQKNIDFDNKYKYLVFDDHSGIRQYKTKPNLNANDMYLSNSYNNYNSNYNPQIRDLPSSIYDNNASYYTPLNSKKYGKTMNFHSPYPHEYQVYYFPTSKPISQYPRQTTERFYRRKPVKQYPEEEVPYLPIRYPKPVRVVERESSFSLDDYDYRLGNKNIEPYTPDYRARYFPPNDNMYHSYDDNSYYYEPDLRHRSFSSITRPCSPVYIRDPLYDRNHLSNSGSLLEKKIRDYVWNPHKRRIEKYMIPNYERSTYYTDCKQLPNKYEEDEIYRTRSRFDSQLRNRKNEVEIQENAYNRNTRKTSPEKRFSYEENVQLQKDDISESPSYKKKYEKPVQFPKRISFDLHNEDIELPNRNNSIGENTDENHVTKERKLILGKRESNAKPDDKRRTSLLSNDNYSISSGKQRVLPSEINGNSRRESLSKQEKLSSIGNSLESDKYFNSKNDFLVNDSNLLEKNVHNNTTDVERIKYDNHNNDIDLYPKARDERHNYNIVQDVPNVNAQRNFKRNSNDNSRSTLIETNEKFNTNNQDQVEIISNKTDNLNTIKKRERFKNEKKIEKESISGSKKNLNNVDHNLEKENYNYTNGLNEPSKSTISSTPSIDHNNDIRNIEQYNADERETAHLQQFINDDNNITHTNNSKTTLPYQISNDSNKETNSIQESSNFKTIPNELEPSTEILNDDYINNTNYYQNYPNNEIEEHPTHEYETQPEHVDEHVANDDNYYTNELDNSNNEKIVEPIQHNEFVDEKSAHDEYYYQNPTDDIKEKPIENQYENPNQQENSVESTHANDDYYYQNDYSNVESKEQPENQYVESDHQQDYVPEPNNHDDYYYQDHARDEEVKEQQGDVQYSNPTEYQGDYTDQQQAHDDYYYQNYSNGDPKGQPENQYGESGPQGEYGDEHIENNDYYYQNHPKENPDENQINQHYSETAGNQGDYVNAEQENYYYEDNSNVNLEGHPSSQYDEHAQQESYPDDQHANDGYYYQNPNENYNDPIAKEQYDGYVGDQHEANDPAYYPDSQSNNYDPQHNSYENNSYQTQQSDYVEPYVQNPTNESYDYSENIAESQSTNQISDEQSK